MKTCSEADQAIKIARASTQRSTELLASLIRIRSLTGEEGEAQAFLADHVRALGADVSLDEPDVQALFDSFPTVAQYPTHWQHDLVLPYDGLPTFQALSESGLQDVLNYRNRPNLVGLFQGTGGGRSLILNGHIDTVTIEPTQSWNFDPFGATVVDGRMVGRGASDMKGGLVAAVVALQCLKEAGINLKGDVILQSVVNEEHAGNGTLDLVRRGFTADAAVVLEPTNNAICVDHTGGLYWQIAVQGTARSPGARWKSGQQEGVSAIEKLPPIIEALLKIERDAIARAKEQGDDGERAAFSMVIGKVLGGHYETVTAQDVLLKGGAYFSPRAGGFLEVMQRMSSAMEDVAAQDEYLGKFRPRLQFLHHDDAVEQEPGIAPAVALSQVLQRAGADSRIRPGPFCCDMRHLVNQGNIPSVIFGPGSIAQAHKPDEHIVVAEFLDAIEHLIEFIVDWCNAEPTSVA